MQTDDDPRTEARVKAYEARLGTVGSARPALSGGRVRRGRRPSGRPCRSFSAVPHVVLQPRLLREPVRPDKGRARSPPARHRDVRGVSRFREGRLRPGRDPRRTRVQATDRRLSLQTIEVGQRPCEYRAAGRVPSTGDLARNASSSGWSASSDCSRSWPAASAGSGTSCRPSPARLRPARRGRRPPDADPNPALDAYAFILLLGHEMPSHPPTGSALVEGLARRTDAPPARAHAHRQVPSTCSHPRSGLGPRHMTSAAPAARPRRGPPPGRVGDAGTGPADRPRLDHVQAARRASCR